MTPSPDGRPSAAGPETTNYESYASTSQKFVGKALLVAAASLAAVAYPKLREHSPKPGNAGLRAMRELAAIVLVCSKAIEGVVTVLAGSRTTSTYAWREQYGLDEFS